MMATDFFQQNKSSISGAHARTLDQARLRLLTIAMFLMMGYLAVGLRLIDLTLPGHSGRAEVPAGREKGAEALVKPLRGSILDRNGNLMAASLKMASVYADATLVDSPETLARQLSGILPELDAGDFLRKLASGKRFVWIQRNVTPKQEYALNALGNPALGFQEESRRIYPDANLTAHVVGYTDVDGNGLAGIERAFDRQLSESGEPIRLTIDLRVQHMLHRELGRAVREFRARAGIGMVMDVNTGEIIALVSLPDFDPNRANDATDGQKFNNATLGVFEMGSTFKLFSVAAALDSGRVRFSSTFDATDPIRQGRFTISDTHPQRRVLTVPEIFIHSSNIGAAKMASFIGNEGMKNFYRTLGFMERAPVELPERGFTLSPAPWRDIDTMTTSYGYGIAVSPLHLIRAASAIVNGGIMPVSTLLKPDENSSPSPAGERIVRAETSGQMRKLLELAVAAGTGGNAWVEGYDVGGKTGTAEKNTHGGYERDVLLSSFLGVFPIRNPRYAVLAILDEPKPTENTHGFATGGWTTAPVVAQVIGQMGPLYQIPPDMARTRKDIEKEMAVYLKEKKKEG
ncbi:MAG: penicillin-binding protein 2 [Pseudomonadota bacterium]